MDRTNNYIVREALNLGLRVAQTIRQTSLPGPIHSEVLGAIHTYERAMDDLLTELSKEQEPVAWCVAYDGPGPNEGRRIHSDPTMYKPEAEELAKRAGLTLVELFASPTFSASLRFSGSKEKNEMTTHKMKISLPGVLNRAAGVCKSSKAMNHLEYPLKELLEHLRILRSQQDIETLTDFFDTWSDQGFEEWRLINRPQVDTPSSTSK